MMCDVPIKHNVLSLKKPSNGYIIHFFFYCLSLEIWIKWVWQDYAIFFYWFIMEQSWLYFLYSIWLYWKMQHNIWKYGSHDQICCSVTKRNVKMVIFCYWYCFNDGVISKLMFSTLSNWFWVHWNWKYIYD